MVLLNFRQPFAFAVKAAKPYAGLWPSVASQQCIRCMADADEAMLASLEADLADMFSGEDDVAVEDKCGNNIV